jgi:hypothetical protein
MATSAPAAVRGYALAQAIACMRALALAAHLAATLERRLPQLAVAALLPQPLSLHLQAQQQPLLAQPARPLALVTMRPQATCATATARPFGPVTKNA